MNKINYIRMGYNDLMIHHKLSDMIVDRCIYRYEGSSYCICYLRDLLGRIVL